MNSPTIDEILKELRRELEVRRKVYPEWVHNGRFSRTTANHRIAMLESAIGLIEAMQPRQPTLF